MTKGIRFGMSPQQVLAQVEPKDVVIESSHAQIMTEGTWDVDGTKRRKTFMFQEGKLDCVRYEPLQGQPYSPVGSVTNCQ